MPIDETLDDWLSSNIAEPARPPLLGVVGRRTASAYLAALAQFRVETHPRYAPQDFGTGRRTKCNVFVTDGTEALGCAVPWRLANEQVQWLDTLGCQKHGWAVCEKSAAAAFARRGWPTLACWVNPTAGESGHVAFVVPSPIENAGVWVAQAGAINRASMPLQSAFGIRPVTFFTHP